MAGALVAAGYTPANAAAPLAGGTYAGTWQIKSLTAKSVANSTVAAAQIGKLQFKAVTIANASVAFGVRARDGIGAVAITKPKFIWKRTGASDQSSGDFHVILP